MLAMIRSEPITKFPEEVIPHLSCYAKLELALAGELADVVLARSEQARLISGDKPICVCGVMRATLLGSPRFWFLLCDNLSLKDLRGLRRQVRELFEYYPRVET